MVILTTIFTDFYKRTLNLNQDVLKAWVDHSLFTWRWWIGFILIVIPLILWFKFRLKKSADRLQYAGVFVAIISSVLETVGTFFGWWKYDYEFLPMISTYIPFSFFSLPITVMFLLQIKPSMNPLIKALIFGLLTLVALPIIKWIGIYDPLNWKYIYSFLIQFAVYLVAHSLSRRSRFEEL